MLQPVLISTADADLRLPELSTPLDLDALVPPPEKTRAAGAESPWEVELGFGKGRYLIRSAEAQPATRFLGVEVVSKYSRMLVRRGRRRGLSNLVGIRAEAMYLMSTVLPRAFARAVHVYFPDPWPKARHHKRRLFDPERVDLLLSLLQPEGKLLFATDFLEYGGLVQEILESHPDLEVEVVQSAWPGGARTNYEAKYVEEGRPIVRLVATLRPEAEPPYFHPEGRAGVLSAHGARPAEVESKASGDGPDAPP